MAINLGFHRAHTDGLVFGYDMHDIYSSYQGEPTTNLISQSENFNTWTKQQVVVTSSVATHKIEKNTITFDKIVSTNTSDPFVVTITSNIGNISSRTFTYSVWLYTDSGQPANGVLFLYGSTSTEEVKSISVTVTNIPTRYVLTGTFTAGRVSTALNVRVDLPTSGLSYWYAGGAQLEEKDHATQYLKTTGTTRTRGTSEALYDYVTRTGLDLSAVSYDSRAMGFFNGSNSIPLSIVDSKILGAQGSIEAVFRRTGTSSYLFRSVGSPTNRFYIQVGSSSISVSRGDPSAGFTYNVTTLDTWFHTVFTWNNSNLYLYVNGVLRGTNTYTNTSTVGGGSRIGAFDAGHGQSFIGYIPVLKIFQTELTASQVINNYNLYKSRYNLG